MAVPPKLVPVDLRGRRAVILGASIAGLAAALTLVERGAEIVLVEADPTPPASSLEEAFFGWSRRRVPQSRHSHAFLARLRTVLADAHPALYAHLLSAGALELRLLDHPPPSLGRVAAEPGDEQLVTLGCRRTTFEWVLQRYVRSLPRVTLRHGVTAEGLLAHPGSPPRVWGVRVRAGRRRRTIAADLVIDATGRGSRAADWLAGIGAQAPFERRSPSGLLYYTRFYRRREGREFPPPGREPTMGDLGWVKYAVFPADNRAFSITFGAHQSLERMKVLANVEAFEALARALPGIAGFLDRDLAEPLPVLGREVLAMGGLENRLRRFVDGRGEPLAACLFVLGDAAYHTNPLYGRGTSQAFMHAQLLGEALDAASGEPLAAGRRLDEAAREEIEPFYRASVAADRVASRKVGAAARSPLSRLYDAYFDDGVLPATRVDPLVYRAFVRVMNMMETPERAFFQPEVVARVLAVWLRGPRLRERYAPNFPERVETIAALEAAARSARHRQAARA
jgi:2-polyprenyl-6-methoxyphenol hydroxylase-like FAD-dependent oxidoreductase